MIATHRLSIYRNEILVGNLDCQGHQTEALITSIQKALSVEDGWSSVRRVSDQEKRILESSPTGIKIISSEKIFRKV